MRLNKYLAQSGECSRRQADKNVLDGMVTVNGILELNPAYHVSDLDEVRFDGRKISPEKRMRTILLNKPEGFITTMKDPQGRKTIIDLIDSSERLFPIGRLDKDTCGVLLLTNNGNLANLLMHPKNRIERIYELEIDTPFQSWEKRKIAKKVYIGQKEWGRAEVLNQKKVKGRVIAQLKLLQGKKREVRRIAYRMKKTLFSLKRIQFGPISLDNTPKGSYRDLTNNELKQLKSLQK